MKGILKSVIKEFHQRGVPDVKKRVLQIPENVSMIISLIGARRSGKTYLMYNVMKSLLQSGVAIQQLVYLNFEDERLNVETSDLDLILQSYSELYPDVELKNVYFFFDEIQNITGWEKFVRRVYDTLTKKIYITGSNSKLLSTEIATSLRGRTITYTVYPLSFREYLEFKEVDTDITTTQNKAKVIHYLHEFLYNGGFPETISYDKELRLKILQIYFNTMIYRDIVERYKVSEPLILKYFLKKMFANVGKPLSVNKIYKDLKSMNYKISNNYLYDYQEYCNTVFLSISIPKFDFSEIKQEKSDKKVYAIDTGLLSAIEFSMSTNLGKLFENMVLLELIKENNEVFYYKDRYECDFIVKKDNIYLPIQVSYSVENQDTDKREIRGLIDACKKLGVNSGKIITADYCHTVENSGISIEYVPVYQYFL